MMKLISSLKEFHQEYEKTAEHVAHFLIKKIRFRRASVIVDLGCGSGVFTIPLAKKLKSCKLIGIDSEKNSLQEFQQIINSQKLSNVSIVHDDVRNIRRMPDNSTDYVVSHWLFGVVVKKSDLVKILRECYRILKDGGIMAHSESNPITKNKSKELYKKADTFIFDAKWWNPRVVREIASDVGFRNLRIHLIDFKLKVNPQASRDLFFDWERMFTSFVYKNAPSGKASRFLDKYEKLVQKLGIKFPTEYIIVGKKI